MKLIAVFLFAACLQVSAAGHSQTITLSQTNVPLKKIFKEIEKQSGYQFFYKDKLLKQAANTNINVVNASVEEVLDICFKNEPLSYTVLDKIIIIKAKEPALSTMPEANIPAAVPAIIINGTVKDENGNALPGVSIVIKGSTKGTSTDQAGSFSIDANRGDVLEFTIVSYLKKSVTVTREENITVVMEIAAATGNDIVMVGYGSQKKVNLTGAVSTLNPADVRNRGTTNMLTLIQGAVPGVTVISRPGQTPSINFRGRGNLGTSDPLFVIDGIISDAGVFSNLSPSSIESISFLKDAASSSIYGSRAAYGVVLVTTKSGKAGRMNIAYSGQVGLKSPTYIPDMADSWEYAELYNEGLVNQNQPAYYTQEQIGWFKDGSKPDYYPDSRWFDLVLDKSVLTTQHALTFSGGTDKIRYFTDLGYVYDDQFMPGQSNKRYNLNTKVSADVTKWLTLNTDITYIRTQGDQTNASVPISYMQSVPSTLVARQSNGEWGSISGGVGATTTFMLRNPLRFIARNDWSHSNSSNTIIDLGFALKPFKGMVITGQGAFRGIETKSKYYTALQDNVKNFETGNEIAGTGVYTNQMSQSWGSTVRMMYTATAKYDWSFGEHGFSVLAGTSYETNHFEGLSASRKNFPTDALTDIASGSSAGTDITNGGGVSEIKLNSYFGRLNYSFKDRYLLEANIRTDGSSNFYKDYRWGVFPSFSAGWRVDKENFMRQVDWIDNLKLRASYGTLGNINNVGNYDYFQNYNTSLGYNFVNHAVLGITESKPANIKLSWEKVAMTDVGIDVEIMKRKLSLTADYYIKKTSNILLGYNVPVEAGIVNRPSQNIGKVENKGFEFALTYKNNISKFTYSITGNAAINTNKITDLAGSDNMIYAGGDKINYIYRMGQSIGSFYGYKTNGLYSQAEIDAGSFYKFGRDPNAGDIKYVPADPTKAFGSNISGDDRVIIGTDVPKFTYGVNVNLQYKNFDLVAFGQGTSGTVVAFETDAIEAFGTGSNPRKFHLKRWTTANPDPYAVFPRLYAGNSLDDYNKRFSEYSLFDADYFRIKNITLGYNIPERVLDKYGVSRLRLYINLENMFTFRADHKMEDFDPETAGGRTLGIGTKTVSFGVNLNLK
ncbi:MAG: TonB-dependent receptor [Bacteroidota bacterium]